jgi:transaldolase
MVDKDFNFSLWLDFIERNFLKGEFINLIERGIINGATSNPVIFAKAIANSSAYDEQLLELKDKSSKEKYEALAVRDIKNAAIALRGVYDEGSEGYISIEIDPFLSDDTEASINEAKRLFKAINEPNVMIKVPATEAGYEVMRELLSNGISVNATLVFSPKQTRACLDAMKKGIDEFENTGGERVEAVVSVFVSRFDTLLDGELESKNLPISKTGVMNASKIYNMIQNNHTPSIRTLFASTSVKDHRLANDYYVRELYGTHCVNTAPLATIEAFNLGEMPPKVTLPIPPESIESYFHSLKMAEIDMERVYEKLFDDGLKAFRDSFKTMIDSLDER